MFYLKVRGSLWSVIFGQTFTPGDNSSYSQIPSLGHKKCFWLFQVVNGCDPSWWQARHEAGDTIGLVPSQVQTRPDQTRPKLKSEAQDLEERRKCFVDQGSGGGGLRKKFACCGAGVSFHCFNAIFRQYHTIPYYTIPYQTTLFFFSSILQEG